MFAGRLLQLVRIYQMTAYVRLAKAGSAALPRWNGGRMPLSSTLADTMLSELDAAERDEYGSPEMRCVQPLLALQKKWSRLPTPRLLLAETLKRREGWHLFLYPFAGRQVHLGLAGLMAWRAATGTSRHRTVRPAPDDQPEPPAGAVTAMSDFRSRAGRTLAIMDAWTSPDRPRRWRLARGKTPALSGGHHRQRLCLGVGG